MQNESRDAWRKDMAELTRELTKLQSLCDEMRIALGAERSKVIDLPALPRRGLN